MRSVEDDLAARAWAVQAAAMARITAAAPGSTGGPVRLFAEGLPAILERLKVLERATSSVVYNLNPRSVFDPQRREREPNQRTRTRGIGGHMITAPLQHLSLVAAAHPDTWVAPVVQIAGIVVDERLGLFAGPPTPDGRPTAWLCRDPDLIMAFCELWWVAKQHAVPIHEAPGVVPLTERQLEVAALLCRGAKDAAIARRLGVSPRTVTSDVGRLLDAFGVATRWEAGMVLGRACPPTLVD
ncbi:helix-turn-helix transcriptional regulator [Micromonospora sp. MS34]|uniref:helix-turn-helix transcriptional regulator n=1 Tax=Micromonospora sp. MS34 TaxID=3385971 RepID=UPI00399FD5E3